MVSTLKRVGAELSLEPELPQLIQELNDPHQRHRALCTLERAQKENWPIPEATRLMLPEVLTRIMTDCEAERPDTSVKAASVLVRAKADNIAASKAILDATRPDSTATGTTLNLTQNVIYLTPPADKVAECKRLEAIIGDGE